MIKRFQKPAVFLLTLLLCAGLLSPFTAVQTQAAQSAVTFGSDSYNATSGSTFKVGVYIKSDETPGTYHVELAYDTDRMTYVQGADEEADGVITLEGTATSTEVKYMLIFTAKSGGNAGIYVKKAEVSDNAGTGSMEITAMASAPITISGTDTSGASDFTLETASAGGDSRPEEMQELEDQYNIPLIGYVVDSNNQDLYVIDLETVVIGVDWTYQEIRGEFAGQNVIFMTDSTHSVRVLCMLDENGDISAYAVGDDDALYPCVDMDGFTYMSVKAVSNWPSDLTEERVNDEGIVFVVFDDGTSGFFKQEGTELIDYNRDLTSEEEETETSETAAVEESTEAPAEAAKPAEDIVTRFIDQYGYVTFAVIVLVILFAIFVLVRIVKAIKKAGRRRRANDYVSSIPPEQEFVPIGIPEAAKNARRFKKKRAAMEAAAAEAAQKKAEAAEAAKKAEEAAAAEAAKKADEAAAAETSEKAEETVITETEEKASESNAAASDTPAEEPDLPVIADPEELLEDEDLPVVNVQAVEESVPEVEEPKEEIPEVTGPAATGKPADTGTIVLPDIELPDMDADWEDDNIVLTKESDAAKNSGDDTDEFERQLAEALRKINLKRE